MTPEDDKKKKRTKDSSTLLDKVIQAMLNQLDRPACEECGFVNVTASDINNMIRFLKDNGFTVDKEETEDYLDKIKREREERAAASKADPDVQSRTA
jgi:polyphosphate kinase